MGRWAQARRSGGGASVIFITRVLQTASAVFQITYNKQISVDQFTFGNFTTLPDTFNGISGIQFSPKELKVTFDQDVTTQTGLRFEGFAPNVVSPQEIDVFIF